MFPSYRNQSVDLLSKSTDWFLYDGNIDRYKVNKQNKINKHTFGLKYAELKCPKKTYGWKRYRALVFLNF